MHGHHVTNFKVRCRWHITRSAWREKGDGKSRRDALTVALVLGDRQMCPPVSFWFGSETSACTDRRHRR